MHDWHRETEPLRSRVYCIGNEGWVTAGQVDREPDSAIYCFDVAELDEYEAARISKFLCCDVIGPVAESISSMNPCSARSRRNHTDALTFPGSVEPTRSYILTLLLSEESCLAALCSAIACKERGDEVSALVVAPVASESAAIPGFDSYMTALHEAVDDLALWAASDGRNLFNPPWPGEVEWANRSDFLAEQLNRRI